MDACRDTHALYMQVLATPFSPINVLLQCAAALNQALDGGILNGY